MQHSHEGHASASAAGSGLQLVVGIGLDATNTASVGFTNIGPDMVATNGNMGVTANWYGYPGVGRHYLAWLEYAQATGTTTWSGDAGGAITLSGISGMCWA